MPCGLLFCDCWIIKMYTCGKKRYTILKLARKDDFKKKNIFSYCYICKVQFF